MRPMASRYVIEPHERFGVIYGLHCGDGVIRYVGQTLRLRARMTEHVIHAREHKNANVELVEWINSVDILHVAVLDNAVPEADLDEAERRRIIEIGLHNLFNRTTGGADMPKGEDAFWFGRRHTAETRAKMGLSGEDHPAYGKRSPKRILTDEEEQAIAARVIRGATRKAVAADLGVSRSLVEKIVKRWARASA